MWSALALAAVGAGSRAPAAPPTQIRTCPFTITQPGQYLLAEDLVCSGNGIVIRASNVHLNLAGHSLTGPNNGTGIGIQVVGATGVHINGGAVQRFGIGIQLLNANGNHINGMVIRDSPLGALAGDGIHLKNANNNHINGNTITGHAGFGVRLENSDGNVFNTNAITDNIGSLRDGGILFLDGSNGNRVTSCDISRNGLVGVWIRDPLSGGNTIQGCTVDDNDVLPDPLGGIVVLSDGNVIRGNTANRNARGIQLSFGATGNLVQSNTAFDNTIRDLLDFNLPACVNTWKDNSFATDNDTGSSFGPGAGCIQ